MSRTPFLLSLIGASVIALLPPVTSLAQVPSMVRRMPPPLVRTSPSDLRAAIVESVTMQTRVVGHNASTHIDIVLRNPNTMAIESALEFPLREGQTVTGFALESLDRSRFLSAAPVEKAKGQAVFEQIVREGTDPALLEKTAGNHFKLRVYPIAPQATRTVRLEISERLPLNASGRLQYQMPQMPHDTQPQKLNFELELDGITAQSVALSEGLRAAAPSSTKGGTHLSLNTTKPLGSAANTVSWPAHSKVFTDYGSMDGEHYFDTQVPLNMASAPRAAPQQITLVWDTSGSGRTRDHAREFAFLDAAFKAWGHVQVQLIEAHVVAENPRMFEVNQGRWQALRAALEQVPYDGASNPAAWSTPANQPSTDTTPTRAQPKGVAQPKDLTLVFSDGIGNWGQPAATPATGTVYTISASTGANTGALRALAEPTGGQLIDLLETPTARALSELSQVRARLVRMTGDGADQLVSASPYAQGGAIQIAGHMTRDNASVTLEFAMPNGSTEQRVVNLQFAASTASPSSSDLAAKRWAMLRIAQLEANARLHQSEILRLGSEFGVVSSRTSLMVLERLEDYLRFDVMPADPQWREQFKQRASDKAAREATEQSQHFADMLQKFENRTAWWRKTFPKGTKAKESLQQGGMVADLARPMAAAPAPVAAAAPMTSAEAPAAPGAEPARKASSRARYADKMSDNMAEQKSAEPTPNAAPAVREMAITLQKQQLTTAYAMRLREAAANERYAVYLDEKTANARSSAFYLDASEIFFEEGQPLLGLRVLSNLAEIELEERTLLRILAYRLQQAKQYEQAILLFKQVLVLAPNEPQSWRDLGLAYAANGQAQPAVDALWTTAQRKWDSRFADIGLIALGELNAIIANTPGLDLSRIDPRLVRNLPVDLRVVMGWDADNTDIDLWVKDPNGEEAYYGHQNTYQGGRISRDFTGGYGPEEYMVKVAKPGRYEVRAKFFGSRQQRFSPYTTVMLRFVTGFGTPSQKEQSVIMRLPDRGSELLVGSFEVKASSSTATTAP